MVVCPKKADKVGMENVSVLVGVMRMELSGVFGVSDVVTRGRLLEAVDETADGVVGVMRKELLGVSEVSDVVVCDRLVDESVDVVTAKLISELHLGNRNRYLRRSDSFDMAVLSDRYGFKRI